MVVLEFLNAKGAVIGQKTVSDERGSLLGLPLTAEPAGEGTFVWDGTLDDGLPVSGNQDITARLSVLETNSLLNCLGSTLGDVLGGGTDGGTLDLSNPDLECADQVESGDVPVEVVTKAPGLTLRTSLGTVFPVRDGYRDSVSLSAKATKAASTSFTLTRANGDVLRRWSGGETSWKALWDGTDSAGKTLLPGTYRLTGTALGEYGNKATRKTLSVRVSGKQFEMRDGEWRLVTSAS